MGHQVYILAGQSNARAMRDSIARTLDMKHGVTGYTLVTVSAPGAPLTYKRADADWAASDELGQLLVSQTLTALEAQTEAEIAGLIWIQGEADTYAIAPSHAYQGALTSLLDNWRDTVLAAHTQSGANTAGISVAQLSRNAGGGVDRDNWSNITAQQLAYGAGEALVQIVDPDQIAASSGLAPAEMFADGLHYSEVYKPALADALVRALNAPVTGDALSGTSSDDTLTGTQNADILTGGSGDDTYIFNHPEDRITETEDQGIDTIIALHDVQLAAISAHVEAVLLAGGAPLSVKGNTLDNHLTGNSGDNRLEGGEGVDVLAGAGGADRLIDLLGGDLLIGGDGDDRYRLHASGSRIEEREGGGHDRVVSSVDFTLRFHSQHIEDLTLTGRTDLSGTGNGLGNRITGNRGENRLDGAWGDDLLLGRAGADTLIGHRGDDDLAGGRGADVFVFRLDHGPGHDRILDFDSARDRLDFDQGIRSLGLIAEQTNDGGLIRWSPENSVLLVGTDIGELPPDWGLAL